MNTLRNTTCSAKKGFTLIEMAIVLVIVGLLIGGGFSTLGAYLDNAKQSHTLGSLKVTKQALLNYVKVNKHMPCPDVYGDGDGKGDVGGASGTLCSSDVGTIPFDDIGLGRSVTADDYGNLFSYAVHKEAETSAVMGLNIAVLSDETALRGFAGSYFYNIGAPAFNLDTPPTEALQGSLLNSYQVCNRHAANNCGGTNDVEVQFIPAVIVAFNENGSGTNLASCGAASRGDRETENCNADMRLIRGSFQEGVFDDQIVTISAYEIKEQALGDFKDPPVAVESSAPPLWESFDFIVNKDFVNSNELNSADAVRNTYLITGDMTTHGSINLKDGNDILTILGTIDIANTIKGKSGHDVLLVSNGPDGYPVSHYGDDTKAALSDAMSKVNDFEVVCYFESLNTCYDVASDALVGDMNFNNTSGTPVVFP